MTHPAVLQRRIRDVCVLGAACVVPLLIAIAIAVEVPKPNVPLFVVLFIGALVNAGLLKEWFQTSLTLRIVLPEEGTSGLSQGSEVQILGTRAGEIRRIVIDPSQRMHAEARIDTQMKPFIRRDSQIVIRRQFGPAQSISSSPQLVFVPPVTSFAACSMSCWVRSITPR